MHGTSSSGGHAIRAVLLHVIALTVAALLLFDVHRVAAKPTAIERKLSSKTAAYSRAQLANTSDGNGVTSYFRHDPYGPNTYAYGFEVNDKATGNVQFRDERRYGNATVEGSYGHVRPDGRVTITRYTSANDSGYLSQTRTFAAGEEPQWQEHWPTRRPSVFADIEMMSANSDDVPMPEGTPSETQNGISLNPIDVANGAVDATIMDIVNGKIPLQTIPESVENKNTKPNNTSGSPAVGFLTGQSLLPLINVSAVTSAPLNLPSMQQSLTPISPFGGAAVASNKYNKAKENNAEKMILKDDPDSTTSLKLSEPIPLTTDNDDNERANWYEHIISDNRREFLENLPNLQ